MMSNNYRNMSTATLERRWKGLRQKIESQGGGIKDIDDLYAIRRELDRRRGERNATTEVDFEKYITD